MWDKQSKSSTSSRRRRSKQRGGRKKDRIDRGDIFLSICGLEAAKSVRRVWKSVGRKGKIPSFLHTLRENRQVVLRLSVKKCMHLHGHGERLGSLLVFHALFSAEAKECNTLLQPFSLLCRSLNRSVSLRRSRVSVERGLGACAAARVHIRTGVHARG